jgi:hypothetical protein
MPIDSAIASQKWSSRRSVPPASDPAWVVVMAAGSYPCRQAAPD